MRLESASDGGNQKDAVTFLEGAGFAAEEADILLVEVDVKELADLAALVADVARETGEARSEVVEGFSDCGRATVNFWRAVGEAAECERDFDSYRHF
jgi:hypothetical protein